MGEGRGGWVERGEGRVGGEGGRRSVGWGREVRIILN